MNDSSNYFRKTMLLGLLLLAGCSTYQLRPAVVADGYVRNPTVGWDGYTLKIPVGMQTEDFLAYKPGRSDLEAMSARIFQYEWNDRDRIGTFFKENFAELIGFTDGKTCCGLVVRNFIFDYPATTFSHLLPSEKRQLYNFALRAWNRDVLQPLEVGGYQALLVSGVAYERKGYVYKNAGDGRRPFAYCAVVWLGTLRDVYYVAGFSEPEDKELLIQNIQNLVESVTFP